MAQSVQIWDASCLSRVRVMEINPLRYPRRSQGICREGGCSRARKRNIGIVRCELDPSVGGFPVAGDSVDLKSTVLAGGVDVPVGADGDDFLLVLDDGDGNGGRGNGEFPFSGGGSGDDESGDEEAAEFGSLLKLDEVLQEVKKRGVNLPSDMLQAAKSVGIRRVLLENYFELQGAAWPWNAITSFSLLRNRMLVDRNFLFKIGTEIVIDSCCATFAEIQKRGTDFWSEFELYMADLLVGLVVNVALVGMLAPCARFGQPASSKGLFSRMARAYNALPSSVFEAERPGCRYSIGQRVATYFYKGVLYGAVGFACGIIGQGIANLIMTAKRSVKKSEEDVPVPPLVKSAALWGVFLAVSSNTRYQIVNGLERIVEASPVSKRRPFISMAFTVGVRFANNVYGGMQFVDWARWSGCQ